MKTPNSKPQSFSCPVKYVIYPQKRTSTKGKAKMRESSQFQANVSTLGVQNYNVFPDHSPTRSQPQTSQDSPASNVKEEKVKAMPTPTSTTALNPDTDSTQSFPQSQSAPTSTNGMMGVLERMHDIVSTPGLWIDRALQKLSPFSSSETGVNRKRLKQEATEELLAESQKKVVFNLRKNKRNNYDTYLKTLAKNPSLKYEGNKSPKQSILKSPSNSSLDWNSADSESSCSNSRDSVSKRRCRRAGGKSRKTSRGKKR